MADLRSFRAFPGLGLGESFLPNMAQPQPLFPSSNPIPHASDTRHPASRHAPQSTDAFIPDERTGLFHDGCRAPPEQAQGSAFRKG